MVALCLGIIRDIFKQFTYQIRTQSPSFAQATIELLPDSNPQWSHGTPPLVLRLSILCWFLLSIPALNPTIHDPKSGFPCLFLSFSYQFPVKRCPSEGCPISIGVPADKCLAMPIPPFPESASCYLSVRTSYLR